MKDKNRLCLIVFLVILSLPNYAVMGADVVDVETCMYLDSSTKEAKGVSTEFLTTTPEVYVRVALTGVTPGYAMWIVWYEPDGAEWYPELIAVTSDTIYWASLEIDSLVRARTGIWKVTVYYGEESENVEEIASVNPINVPNIPMIMEVGGSCCIKRINPPAGIRAKPNKGTDSLKKCFSISA